RFCYLGVRCEGRREAEIAEAAVELGAQLSERLDEDGIHAAVRRLTPIEIASAGRVIAVGFATGRVGEGGAPFEPDDAPSVAAHGDGADRGLKRGDRAVGGAQRPAPFTSEEFAAAASARRRPL